MARVVKGEEPQLVDIATHLTERSKTIHTRAINLNDFEVLAHGKFKIGNLELYVGNVGSGESEQLDALPIKQLCSAIGMNLGFYMDNPSALNTTIFNERLRNLDEGERMLRYRVTPDGNRLLSILPMTHQAPGYHDVINPLLASLPDNHIVRLANFEDVDNDHRLTMRVSLLDFPVDVKERDGRHDEAELGFFIDMSEDGRGGKMTATSMVYNQYCSNGAMVAYDRHPYFEYNYRGIKAVDLGAAITSALGRFGNDLNVIVTRLAESEKKIFSKPQASAFLKSLENRRDLSLGFIRKVRKEIEGNDFEHITHYRVLNAITEAAQKLAYDQRVQHEYAAGNLLGLNLSNAA